MPDWLTTTLSVIAGGALTIAGGWLADRRLTERDRERRREERRVRLADRSNDFQRETLLALQVASQKLLRNTVATLHQDITAYRASGVWQRQLLPESLSDDQLQLATETMLLASRVRDENIRVLAERLRKQTAEIPFSKDEFEAQRQMVAAGETQGLLVEAIGKFTRELDVFR